MVLYDGCDVAGVVCEYNLNFLKDGICAKAGKIGKEETSLCDESPVPGWAGDALVSSALRLTLLTLCVKKN